MTRADDLRAAHARRYDTVAEGACAECDLVREVMVLRAQVGALTTCGCGDTITRGTVNATGCTLGTSGWICGNCCAIWEAP